MVSNAEHMYLAYTSQEAQQGIDTCQQICMYCSLRASQKACLSSCPLTPHITCREAGGADGVPAKKLKSDVSVSVSAQLAQGILLCCLEEM